MRRRLFLVVMALLLAVSFVLPGRAEGLYTVKLKPEGGVQIDIGKTYALETLIEPVNLIEHALTWSSDNNYVASVNDKGVVTARAAGATYVRVTLETGAQARCRITVSGRAVTQLAIDNADVELAIGKSEQLTYTINADADDKRVEWSTDDNRVATVSADGRVTAVGYGTAVITLTAVNGMTATASVFVPSDVKNIMLDPENAMIALGASITLDAYVFPGNARDRELTWESSNPRVVAVDDDGVITGVSIGSATVRVSTKNGVSAHAEITVAKLPTALSLSDVRVVLSRQIRTHQLDVKIEPASARDCELTWSSSDPDVVAVRGGKLTAQGYGTAIVRVQAQNGLYAECRVAVAEEAESIRIIGDEYKLFVGGAGVPVEYALTPDYGYAEGMIWSIEDESVARIDEMGVLYGISKGETRVRVTALGGASADALVRVFVDARYVELNAESLSLGAGQSAQLQATYSPEDTSDVEILWKSEDNAVAVVADGLVFARAPGETAIVAYTADGALTARCLVAVSDTGWKANKRIALTFDNGPGEYTQQILETLDDYGARATFFLCGASVEKRPGIAALYADTPHELGNHTYNNKSLNKMSLSDVATSIEKTDALIIKATGRQATVLRAPDANLPKRLFNSFFDARRFVGWTTDTGDMIAAASEKTVTEKALAGAFDTAILVFRDASAPTSNAMDGILARLIMDGYEFLTVSELIVQLNVASDVFVTKR